MQVIEEDAFLPANMITPGPSKRSCTMNETARAKRRRSSRDSLDSAGCSDDGVDDEEGSEDEGSDWEGSGGSGEEHAQTHPKQYFQPAAPSTWSEIGSMKTFEFTKMQQLLVPYPTDPFEAFRLFLNDDILDMIVRETNKNAERELQQPGVSENSRITSWKELTREEFLIFLGLLLHTGTIRLNKLTDYWKKHWLFDIPCFGKFMSRNRFMLVLRCLHFSSESTDVDRLAKIRPIIDNFNNTMKNIYCPGKQLYLDESMVLVRDRLLFRQNLKVKRQKNCVRLYVLAEPEGIMLKFNLCADASKSSGVARVKKIVLDLMEERLDAGHSVYMNNYYNSYDLATKLLDRQTYCTGTLGTCRKDNPIELSNVILRQGENKSLYLNGVHVGKWKEQEKNHILYISTEYDGEMIEVVNKKGQVLFKPAAIVHYNNFMSGVDLQDQMLTYYPCERKHVRTYKKIFMHTLQVSLSNAFCLYNKFCAQKKWNLYDFRLFILERLLPNPNRTLKKLMTSTEHTLTKIDNVKTREKKEGSRIRVVNEVVRKECRGCRKDKKRVATLFECKACVGSPGYCTKCFFEAHS